MSHTYPLASSAVAALESPDLAARTRYEAERLAGEDVRVVSLETEWLTLDVEGVRELMERAEVGVGEGFVQRYENADGTPVLAVTYWRLVPQLKGIGTKKTKAKPKPPKGDHTDDLYFKTGRTKTRRRRGVHPQQLDLFEEGTVAEREHWDNA
ncbi:MAG: hypothetical protein AAFS13_08420 [Pseudomonadota bacterium]